MELRRKCEHISTIEVRGNDGYDYSFSQCVLKTCVHPELKCPCDDVLNLGEVHENNEVEVPRKAGVLTQHTGLYRASPSTIHYAQQVRTLQPGEQDLNPLQAFETYLITQKQISVKVARNYVYAAGKFLRWINTQTPTQALAMQYFRYLQDQGYANSTIANIVYALNHYFQFLGLKIQLTPPKRHRRQPTFLTVEEAQSLIRIILTLRDRAIVVTLLYTGMRVNELCSLDIEDLHLEDQAIMVRDTKTYHDRKVVISEIVMKEYKNLQEVERCFNDLKNVLKLRPVYHWTDRRTKGHVFVCVLSLLLEKLMEKHTNKTFREVKETLELLRVNRIEVYGEEIYKRNSISSGGDEVLSDLGVENPPKVLVDV